MLSHSWYLDDDDKYCFNVFLKIWTDGNFLISDGNLFQTKGP